jgi:hypothetical protein
MSALFLAAAVLCAPPTPNSPHKNNQGADAPRSPKELREVYREAVRASYQKGPTDAVPKLVEAYKVIDRDRQLSNVERGDLKVRLRSRMIAVGDKIVEDARREMRKRERDKAAGKRLPLAAPAPSAGGTPAAYAATGGSQSAPRGAAGGRGEEDNAEELIELIRTTVAPQSWDTAGGPGSIYYYRPVHALVIHQTQEVHWLIGGLSGALRK